MRDGVRLFTRIYTPDSIPGPLPILIMRSPYSDWNIGVKSPEADPIVKELARGGYIFVYQNIRGKQKSEGEFFMEQGLDKYNAAAIDEATDTYDLIDWLLNNVPSNGKVGQLGISYPGELSLISAVKPHPALKAASPQGTVADFFLGDDYFHNGAFRLAFSYEYVFSEEAVKGDTVFPFPMYDLYDWYLELGPLSNVNKKYFHGDIPSWNDFVAHPNYDSYWIKKAPISYTDTPLVPILHVGGFWDQENMNGPEALYAKMNRYDTHNFNHIILGPWCHGQWSDSDASTIGAYKMQRNTANDFKVMQKKWFDYWLKGEGTGGFAKATCFQTGVNKWKDYDEWPPRDVTREKIYLRDHRKLSFDAPAAGDHAYESYISDPDNPLPYRIRPIELSYSDSSDWDIWLVEDQRFVEHRPDMISFKSDTLTSDVTVTGDVVAHLFAATTGTDADWVVKLIDANPDNSKTDPTGSQYELMIASDIFRGRFRKGFGKPEAIPANKVEEYTISLHQVNHVFRKGHRIMVQVQSSWFPLFDRNPQHYMPNIFKATQADFIKTTQHIYHSPRYPSSIEISVVKSR